MVVMITPVAFNNIGWRTYLIFAVFNAAGVPIMYFFYPETKDRSLEEVDLIFRNAKNLRQAIKLSFVMAKHYDNEGNLIRSVTHDIEDEDGSAHIDEVKGQAYSKVTISDVEHREETL